MVAGAAVGAGRAGGHGWEAGVARIGPAGRWGGGCGLAGGVQACQGDRGRAAGCGALLKC